MEATNTQQFEGERITFSIGMMVAMVSFSMLFASLFLGFAIFRINAPVWPPMGLKKPELLIPMISTGVIALSSIFIEVFLKNISLDKNLKAQKSFYLSLFFGILFIVSQFYLWGDLKSQGLFASSGIYGSLIYAFTWIHAGHMALGLGMLLFLTPLVIKKEFSFKNKLKFFNVAKFWHFLAIVWGLMFLFLFIF